MVRLKNIKLKTYKIFEAAENEYKFLLHIVWYLFYTLHSIPQAKQKSLCHTVDAAICSQYTFVATSVTRYH